LPEGLWFADSLYRERVDFISWIEFLETLGGKDSIEAGMCRIDERLFQILP
jgi:hypothetical protein